MFVRLLKLDESVRELRHVQPRAVVHAAAPCPVPVKQSMIDWLGPVVHEYYAGTEGNRFVYCNSEQWLAHPGTVGVPILSKVHICDEEGNEVPTGERHRLLRVERPIRVPQRPGEDRRFTAAQRLEHARRRRLPRCRRVLASPIARPT